MADISIQKFEFTKNWNNPTDFPTFQSDETQVRADQQELHNQTRDFVNNVLIGAVMKVITENQEYVEQAVAEAILGTVPDKSIGIEKLACAVNELLEDDAANLPTSLAVAVYIKNALDSYMNKESVEKYVENNAAPPTEYGITDVADGSASSYPEGTLYVVLE